MTCHLLSNLSLEFGRSRSVCITERKNAASTERFIHSNYHGTSNIYPSSATTHIFEDVVWSRLFVLNVNFLVEYDLWIWKGLTSFIFDDSERKKTAITQNTVLRQIESIMQIHIYIYVVILYAITGIFCMWTAILLLRTHIFSFIHRRILAHFRTSIPLTVCNSISNRSVLVVVNFVFSPLSVWFIRACCAIPWNEIPRNGTLELVLLFRIIFRTLIITGTVLRNVLEHEKLFLSHLSSAPIFIWFSLLLKCFYFLLLRLIAESFSTF